MNKFQSAAVKWLGLSYLVDAANWAYRWKRPLEPLTINTIGIEVNESDLDMLVSDSRKLYCNLGPVKGAINDKATYAIGRSWVAKSGAKDKAWAKEAETLINELWYPTADIRGDNYDFKTDLWVASVSVDRDGTIYAIFTESPDGWPQIQLIPSHMVGQRDVTRTVVEDGPYRGLRIRQGIIFNDKGRAVAYHVLGQDAEADQIYSARDMMQIFNPEWADQIKGFPAATHAILDMKDLRTVQDYEKTAAMLMASIGLVEDNELGAPDPNDPQNLLTKLKTPFVGPNLGVPTITTQTATGVTTRFFRSGTGSGLKQLKSDRPGDAVSKFMDRLLRNFCVGIDWPYELLWDLGGLNGGAVRLLLAKAMRSVEDRQDLLTPFAKRSVGYATAKFIKLGRLRANEDWHKWTFSRPARMTADYGRDAKADLNDLNAGIRTLTSIVEEEGGDLDRHIETLKTEREKLTAAGLPLPAQPGLAPVQPIEETDEERRQREAR